MTGCRICTITGGCLFIIATAATMLSHILIEPFLLAPDILSQVAENRNLFLVTVLLEIINSLASAGIAIALFPILRCCLEGLAVAYLGLRVIEAGLGFVAAIGLLLLLSPVVTNSDIAFAGHDWAFLLLLLVFSLSTLVLYPLLFIFRLVPAWLSIWGFIGGVLLLASVMLVLFGQIKIGSTTDTLLSLPIWINEMALALWLIIRGVDLSAVQSKNGRN